MRFRPKTRRIMAIAFAVVVIIIMVVPSISPTVAGCVPPRQRAAPAPSSAPSSTPPSTSTPAQGQAPPGATSRSDPAAAPVRVHAPNAPIASIVRALAPDAVVSGPWVGSVDDPAFWKPTGDDIAALQNAELVVLNGAGYEPWAQQAALPRARTLDLGARVGDRLIAEDGSTHSHGPEGEHSHAGTAFTTWLSPAILRVQAQAIAAELVKLRPGSRGDIGTRLDALDRALAELGAALGEVARMQPRWLGSHPVYQYLAQAGGLTVDCVHWEPGEVPAEAEWAKFVEVRANAPRPIAFMLWEGEPGQAMRDRLRAEGVEPIVFSPLGAGDRATADFVAYFKDRVQAMRAAADRR